MLDESKYEELKLEREGRLLTITLNRPESLNAVIPPMHRELASIWHDIADDDDIGAVILTGAGRRGFCAGANVKWMGKQKSSGRQGAVRSWVEAKRIIADMMEVEQPIIGAINGDAIGFGASLALNCDIIVANETARFADTHVKNLGVVAGDGGTVTWPLMMGIHKAKEFLFTGDFLVASDAARMGWINFAVPYEDMMPKAREIALRLAHQPQWALRWTKAMVNKIQKDLLNLTMDAALAAEHVTFASEDHREAMAAFMEKRPPKYTGR